jgi:hypothetical protein
MAFNRMLLTAIATNVTSIIGSLVGVFSQDIPDFLRYMVTHIGKPAGLRNQFYR